MTTTYPISVTIVSRKAMRVSEFPRTPYTKLSEKSRTLLQRSLTGHRNGTCRPVLAFVYRPNLRSKRCSYPFSDSFTNGILGNLACIRLHTYAVPGHTQAYLFIGLSRRVLLENRASGTLDSRKLRSMKRAGVIIPGPVLLPLAPAVLLTPPL